VPVFLLKTKKSDAAPVRKRIFGVGKIVAPKGKIIFRERIKL